MTELGDWLRVELSNHNLTQHELAAYAGVGVATISDNTLNKDHIPKVEALFRLADYLGASRERVVRIAGHLPPALADPTTLGRKTELQLNLSLLSGWAANGAEAGSWCERRRWHRECHCAEPLSKGAAREAVIRRPVAVPRGMATGQCLR